MAFAAEIQFYATEEKAKPVVTKLPNFGLRGIDFLHADRSASGGIRNLGSSHGVSFCGCVFLALFKTRAARVCGFPCGFCV